tara:strand:- start:133 stop:492 length:360 start_codon:yes stop_codon:yes gene_type:complete
LITIGGLLVQKQTAATALRLGGACGLVPGKLSLERELRCKTIGQLLGGLSIQLTVVLVLSGLCALVVTPTSQSLVIQLLPIDFSGHQLSLLPTLVRHFVTQVLGITLFCKALRLQALFG